MTVADIDPVGGEETVRKVRAEGGNAVFFETDVTRSDMVQVAVSKTISQLGKIDILYKCAGVDIFIINPNTDGTVVRTREEDWDGLLAMI